MNEYGALFVAANLVLIVALLVFTRIKPWVLFMCSSCALFLSGVQSLDKVMIGYTNPSLLVLVLLICVSIPLERTSLIRRSVDTIVSGSERRSAFKLVFFSAGVSSFLNNTAVVSAMLAPLRKQESIPASRLLLPLSYASIVGGTLTLIGTSTNLIVNGFVQQAGYPSLEFFEFSYIGLPVALVCLVAIVLLAPRILRDRQSGQTGSAVKEYFIERQVKAGSPLIDRSIQENGLRNLQKIFLVEVIRDHRVIAPVNPQLILEEGDVLVFSGDVAALDVLDGFQGLDSPEYFDTSIEENLVEVIVSPTSRIVGKTIKSADFRFRFGAAVVAVRRGDERLKGGLGKLRLKAGDALVLAVGEDFRRRNEESLDFILVGGVDVNRPLNYKREIWLLTGFGTVIGLGASGFVPLVKGLMILVLVLLYTRMLRLEDIRTRFPFDLLIVIAGALALSQAMFDTGLSDLIGNSVGAALNGLSPVGALIVVFLATWLMTELITNNAAAAIMFPLALAASSQWGGDYMPFVMAVAFGASASFLSPFGYQTNLMVYTAGNYRTTDYFRFGFPVLCLYVATAITMIVVRYGL
ncbi:MAG: SLC13 family permease [bacterium]